jgi:hypothetical protein
MLAFSSLENRISFPELTIRLYAEDSHNTLSGRTNCSLVRAAFWPESGGARFYAFTILSRQSIRAWIWQFVASSN